MSETDLHGARTHVSRRPGRWRIVFLTLLVIVAFVPRAAHPVSRPLQWYERSYRFVEAAATGAWRDTVVSEHPGVTPMWLVGLAQHAYQRLRRAGGEADYALRSVDRAFDREVAASVLPLALAIALLILAVWFLLRRLFGEAVAWAGAGLLALDPFHIAMSKVVHLDALLSLLMLVSALLLLLYLRPDQQVGSAGRWQRNWLVLVSGVVAGLAFLTKSPAYFLVPYLGLCLIAARGRAPLVSGYLAPALLWLGAAALTYVLVWPAMWVEPWTTLVTVFGGVVKHAARPHPQPIYFLGQLVTEDPGLGYYLVAIVTKTTMVSLPLFVLGLLSPIGEMEKAKRRTLLLVVGYFGFFLLQMSLGAKKAPRYLLPAFPAIAVIAGVGLVKLGQCATRWRTWLRPATIVPAALALQAALVLSFHPYYVTHGNLLAGGASRARRLVLATPEGEGLDIAASYLNQKPNASHLRVGVQLPAREAFSQVFVGETLDTRAPGLDYLVFAPVYVQRGLAEDQWGDQWREARFRVPEHTVLIHGEPYAWVYTAAEGPQQPTTPLAVCLDDAIRLAGVTFVDGNQADADRSARPGEDLPMTLHWQATGSPQGDYTVFVHLVDAEGNIKSQADHIPRDGTHPTFLWQAGERVDDPFALHIPAELTPGVYSVVVGLYDWQSGDRLRLSDECAEESRTDSLVVSEVEVVPDRIPWWQVVLLVVATAVVIGGTVFCILRKRAAPESGQAQSTSSVSGQPPAVP